MNEAKIIYKKNELKPEMLIEPPKKPQLDQFEVSL